MFTMLQFTLIALAACLFACATAAPAPQCKKASLRLITDKLANVWLPLQLVSFLAADPVLVSEREMLD